MSFVAFLLLSIYATSVDNRQCRQNKSHDQSGGVVTMLTDQPSGVVVLRCASRQQPTLVVAATTTFLLISVLCQNSLDTTLSRANLKLFQKVQQWLHVQIHPDVFSKRRKSWQTTPTRTGGSSQGQLLTCSLDESASRNPLGCFQRIFILGLLSKSDSSQND